MKLKKPTTSVGRSAASSEENRANNPDPNQESHGILPTVVTDADIDHAVYEVVSVVKEFGASRLAAIVQRMRRPPLEVLTLLETAAKLGLVTAPTESTHICDRSGAKCRSSADDGYTFFCSACQGEVGDCFFQAMITGSGWICTCGTETIRCADSTSGGNSEQNCDYKLLPSDTSECGEGERRPMHFVLPSLPGITPEFPTSPSPLLDGGLSVARNGAALDADSAMQFVPPSLPGVPFELDDPVQSLVDKPMSDLLWDLAAETYARYLDQLIAGELDFDELIASAHEDLVGASVVDTPAVMAAYLGWLHNEVGFQAEMIVERVHETLGTAVQAVSDLC